MGWGGAPAGTPACLGTGTEGGRGEREGGREGGRYGGVYTTYNYTD